MNTAPQQVTERYLTNLLRDGQNKEFYITHIDMRPTTVSDTHIGNHFSVDVARPLSTGSTQMGNAIGATIAQALRRALEYHGVTFR